MALPAFAIVSEIIPVFSRKPIFGYEFVAASSVAIAVLSLGVWGHHMFTVGMGRPLDVFFAISSMLIAIPTGVKVLNWTATMIGGRIRFQVPMLFCIAFLIQFLVACLTGLSHASVALDWPPHFSEAKSPAITPGKHGLWNGRQRHRRRTKTLLHYRRSAAVDHYGT